MPYVEVDVDLDDFDDQDLIDELEDRGWWVAPHKDYTPDGLSDEEKDWICEKIIKYVDLFDLTAMSIYEKMKKQ